MIKQLRLKFILITMISLVLLLIAILVSTNIIMKNNLDNYMDAMLLELVENNGEPRKNTPRNIPEEELDNFTNFASIILDKELNIIEIIDHNNLLGEDKIEDFISPVILDGVEQSIINNLRYLWVDKDRGSIMVFVDKGIQDVMYEELVTTSIVVGTVSIFVLFILVIFLSRQVTEPVDKVFKKQKRFIADSSHELKTPLTILTANAYMLKNDIGKNEWLDEIDIQTSKMRNLIDELLVLAKTENMNTSYTINKFNLSNSVESSMLSFEVLAFEQSKEIVADIENEIFYKGNETSILQMIGALTDNAIKYSKDKSSIDVKLYTKGSKSIFEIKNQCDGIGIDNKAKIFDKFYRVEEPRNDGIEGYGLGLSIVKNIVDLHHGKIEVDTKKGEYVIFKVIL